MKQEAPRHPKMLMLAEKLDLPLYSAVGIMELLWNFTGFYAPRGDIGRVSDRAIAEAVGWKKKPEILVNAIVSCGFLDVSEEHRLIVHDWNDHAQEWVKKRLKRVDQQMILCRDKVETPSRQKQDKSQPRAGLVRLGSVEGVIGEEKTEPEKEAAHVQWREEDCKAFLKQIKWDAQKPSDAMADAILSVGIHCLPDTFDEFPTLAWLYSALGLFERIWPLYWLKKSKMEARAAFLKALAKYGTDIADDIESGINLQAPEMLKREAAHRPHMATWLNGERWKDEISPVSEGRSAWGAH